MSRLEVQAADLTRFDPSEERMRQEGIEITTLEKIGADNEAFLRDLYAMESRALLDIPSTEAVQPDPYEEWAERVLHHEGRSPRWFWIALDGNRPVGVARVSLRGTRAAMHGLTGVDREYRGRGIAKALKLRTVEWARENGIDFLYTGNDLENHAMLAINGALGYAPLPCEIEVVKEIGADHRATE